ncbi:centromere protein W-like [Amphiura filiformis]|uniref:centromere protein W-like n=1 Tax=Amphiura filiformis TaxID=82378 RepID=UPI003B21B7F9
MKRAFPRSKLKSIVKKRQSKARLKQTADLLMFLDYMLFLRKLAMEANVIAQRDKEKVLTAAHINLVMKDVLKEFRG